MMNQINPNKLLKSKWTAIKPINKEKHFMVNEVEFDEEGNVLACTIEAVMSKRSMPIQWQELKDIRIWQQDWK
ncbi:TIGR02450 family Trp-rich protein [Rheinheimera sp. UJ51]|uniref:TIGR02450 family Trp-rich protein n=1 Tax=Rheinheimera sp. UJ51 TaxID=2892446 RepID=UPI001E3E6F47|nr:TIGR02450 family Trp-rich protein [Rheinheimera sp. UJ51]MCC5452748.1 TIGR02450 family Trp-rich protein [Rheinheimera sp. UJ51]